MPPLQSHPAETTYSVIEGSVTFFVGDALLAADAGDVVVAPDGVAHTFRLESDRARWRIATRVSSVARFDDLGRALACPGSMTENDEATVGVLAAANGIRILGSPGTLPSDQAA
jgi:hypothetical protein